MDDSSQRSRCAVEHCLNVDIFASTHLFCARLCDLSPRAAAAGAVVMDCARATCLVVSSPRNPALIQGIAFVNYGRAAINVSATVPGITLASVVIQVIASPRVCVCVFEMTYNCKAPPPPPGKQSTSQHQSGRVAVC